MNVRVPLCREKLSLITLWWHEMLHTMKNKNVGNVRWLTAKLDMTKAGNKVEWDFLKGIMKRVTVEYKRGSLWMIVSSFFE